RLFEETLEGDYSGWEIYTDAGFGLAFMYPVNCGVVDSSDTSVEIEGKLDEEGNHWPVFRVEYHDSELYHPPEGADLRSWLGENDPVLSRELGSEFMRFGDPVTIAGFLADHVIFRSYQAVDQDLYYFVRGDQLYRITLFHVGRREDWDLYNKFLSSFTFF
ncbi:hypothetical protein L6258_02130, partial [Candidatus Parcubacteria bacterium]|nr:hypothetical protein [Candidatus Parcubacteria bacterium]